MNDKNEVAHEARYVREEIDRRDVEETDRVLTDLLVKPYPTKQTQDC